MTQFQFHFFDISCSCKVFAVFPQTVSSSNANSLRNQAASCATGLKIPFWRFSEVIERQSRKSGRFYFKNLEDMWLHVNLNILLSLLSRTWQPQNVCDNFPWTHNKSNEGLQGICHGMQTLKKCIKNTMLLDCREDEKDLQQSIFQQILLFTRMSWGTATHLDLNLTCSRNYQ